MNVKASEFIYGIDWSFPTLVSYDLVDISRTMITPPRNMEDWVIWVILNDGKFNCNVTYDYLRQRKSNVLLFKTIWLSCRIPKCAFTLCISCFNKL